MTRPGSDPHSDDRGRKVKSRLKADPAMPGDLAIAQEADLHA